MKFIFEIDEQESNRGFGAVCEGRGFVMLFWKWTFEVYAEKKCD